MADDVTYSGTVAGAMEGTLLGIRSIALSQAYNWSEDGRLLPWDVVETLAPELLRKLIAISLPAGTLLNVNFPNCPVDAGEGRPGDRAGADDPRACRSTSARMAAAFPISGSNSVAAIFRP